MIMFSDRGSVPSGPEMSQFKVKLLSEAGVRVNLYLARTKKKCGPRKPVSYSVLEAVQLPGVKTPVNSGKLDSARPGRSSIVISLLNVIWAHRLSLRLSQVTTGFPE